ncbi:SusC/RagA family TonB-linked outer membrane protein [Chitinophaga sp. RAB17]|uniref:SusC/RagA family TonB-linked outer membrane protein n=1 Tax=Chitinophaga sp. RAB17 TaxID=3233049 RepID=UPI003F92433D
MKLIFHRPPLSLQTRVRGFFYLVSRLTTVLLLLTFLQLSAAVADTGHVTISRKNVSLETIFREIKQQTGYLFFYKGSVNIEDLKQDVSLKDVTLEEALRTCLSKFTLTYTIVNKTIVISNKAANTNVTTTPLQEVTISGRITDSTTHTAMVAVTISVKNKNIYTQSNETGLFKIEAGTGDVLVFSSIGFRRKEVLLKNTSFLNILMAPNTSALGDVVITGYQVIKKDNYTGNAITVKGEELKRLNPQNILKGLASFDPSFRIAENNLLGSDPNALPKINVRGSTAMPSMNGEVLDRNNLSSSYNLPVFIMDGFEVPLQKVVDFDINRIASITILKDAAATAVYGSRAANGVIVITTKTPIPGRLRLTYNYELNATAADLTGYHVLNATDKLAYEKLAGLYNAANTAAYNQEDLDKQYYAKLKNVVSGYNTYWLSQPLRNTYGQKHSMYAEGGDSTFRYGIDLRYQTNPGVMKGSGRDRYSGGMNFNYNPTRTLLIKNEITVTQVNEQNSKYGSFSTYVGMNPYYRITDANGKPIREIANWKVDTKKDGPDQIKNVPVYNPLFEASLGNFDKAAYLELIDALSVDWKINPALRLIGLVSMNNTKSTADKFVSPFSNTFFETPASEILNRGSYYYSSSNGIRMDGNLRVVFNKQLGEHALNAVLGSNITYSKTDFKSFEARGFSNDKFTNIGFARTYAENAAPIGDVPKSSLIGSFFNGSYSYQNKYLMDAAFRVDGSSSFGSDQKYAPFWSAGIGWNVHNEAFFQKMSSVLSRLKITATYGVTGSVDFPPYLAKTIYTYQTANWYSTGIGAVLNGYGNKSLQWQKTYNTEVRGEIGLWHDRLVINPVYYNKLTKGLLTDINLAPSTGYTTYKANLGDMSNKGYELYLTANAYRSRNLNINITGNLAHNTNTIVKISNALKAYNESVNKYQLDPDNNAQGKPLLRYAEGQSTNTIYAVKSMGIDPQNGKELYVASDGSLTYNYNINDTRPVGDYTPKIEGYFGSNITYKNFMFSFSFYYKQGGDMYNQTLVDRVENADPRFNVDSRALTQRWIKPGDIALYKNIANLNTTYATSRFIQKDNLLELQSLYLSYDVKSMLTKRMGLQSLRGAVTMNDIFRTSSVRQERGIDYPFARSLTCSILATF